MLDVYERYPQLEGIRKEIEAAADLLVKAAKKGKDDSCSRKRRIGGGQRAYRRGLMKSFIRQRPIERIVAETLIEVDQSMARIWR